MKKNDYVSDFINKKSPNEKDIEQFLIANNLTKKQLIKLAFKILNSKILELNGNEYSCLEIKKYVEFISFLSDSEEMDKDEIATNRERIKKTRELLLAYTKSHKKPIILEAANLLDEIILDKNIDEDSLVKLIKELIDRKEDIEIIKKLININKKVILVKNNSLFDYVFQKALKSLKNDDTDIYYYITLLKIVYHSGLDKGKYTSELNSISKTHNIFNQEIYAIIYGQRRLFNCDEIIDKYQIETKPPYSPIIIPKGNVIDETTITIDGSKTFLRDDAFSIKKDGNNFIVGIHISDAGKSIEYKSAVDAVARKNFKNLYLDRGGRTHMFSPRVENSLSLNKNTERSVITLYVVLNDSGEMLDYYIKENNVIVNANLSYLESEKMLDYYSYDGLENSLRSLFELASALEKRYENKNRYWLKKESSRPIQKNRYTRSDKIVREFAILYNRVIGKLAKEEGFPFIYRIQNDEYISALINDMQIPVNDYTQQFLDNLFLESEYSSEPLPHVGLDINPYAQVCNPLRKYPDLYNQYMLHTFYFGDKIIDFDYQEYLALIEYANERSRELALLKAEYNREMRLVKKK